MHRHRPVRVGFPHGHMMFRRHRSVDPHTDTHHRRRRGRSDRTSVDTHEGLSLRSRRRAPSASSRQSRHARELTNGGRVPSHGAAHTARGTCLPTHSRAHDDGRHARPPMLVGDPVPTERPAPPPSSNRRSGNDRSTNSLNRACQETDPGQRSLSRARSSPENRRHRDPSQHHRTWPPPRTGDAPKSYKLLYYGVLAVVPTNCSCMPSRAADSAFLGVDTNVSIAARPAVGRLCPAPLDNDDVANRSPASRSTAYRRRLRSNMHGLRSTKYTGFRRRHRVIGMGNRGHPPEIEICGFSGPNPT